MLLTSTCIVQGMKSTIIDWETHESLLLLLIIFKLIINTELSYGACFGGSCTSVLLKLQDESGDCCTKNDSRTKY